MGKIKDIKVPTSWRELNEWQVQEIAHLFLNAQPNDVEVYIKMILICYQKSNSYSDFKKMKKIAKEITISDLEEHVQFLQNSTDFHSFPEIEGLIKPSDRIENITIRQFSTIDTFFHFWNTDRSEINLKRLVATLYRKNEKFDDLDLIEVSKITDKIPVKKMEAIALAFLFTLMHIEDRFPIVFPKPKEETEEDKLTPVFHRKENKFVPFDKVIVGMAMDELQPLGKKQDADQVRVYEFLGVLSESIMYHKAKAAAHGGK